MLRTVESLNRLIDTPNPALEQRNPRADAFQRCDSISGGILMAGMVSVSTADRKV